MRFKAICVFAVIALSLPLANATAYSMYVSVDGRDWYQPVLAPSGHRGTVDQVCDPATGACAGAYQGWTWANYDEVSQMLSAILGAEFLPTQQYSNFSLGNPALSEFFQLFSPTFSTAASGYPNGGQFVVASVARSTQESLRLQPGCDNTTFSGGYCGWTIAMNAVPELNFYSGFVYRGLGFDGDIVSFPVKATVHN